MQVQRLTAVYPRILYDTLFGFVPGVKQVLEAAGGAAGTTGNCEALMSAVSLGALLLLLGLSSILLFAFYITF